MKKYMIVIILCLFLFGCAKETVIETIVENNSNFLIAINYPTTNIKKIDTKVDDYIKSVYEGFKNEYENFYALSTSSELNIDYRYFQTGKYINVVLYTFINSSKLSHPINEIRTFIYDTKKDKIINLSDLIDFDKLKEITPYIQQEIIKKYQSCVLIELLASEIIPSFDNYPYFLIENENLVLYFEPYKITSGNCGVINIEVPLSKLDIKIENNDKEKLENTINVSKKTIDPTKKVVAITFDDGPSRYTNEILDILDENNASATFFVLGNKVKIYSETINKAISLGNEIGNHSYNHKWLTRLKTEEFKEQIEKTQNIIKEVANYTPLLLRPTYGSVNKRIKSNTELEIVLWDVDSLDWKIKNSEKIADRVLKDIDDMDVILFHDTYERTMKSLKIIVPKLVENGYQLVTISELKEIRMLRNKF